MSRTDHRVNVARWIRRVGLLLAGSACVSGFLVASVSVASASRQETVTNPACSVLDDTAGSAKFLAQIAQDERTNNLPAMKQLFLTLVTDMQKLPSYGPLRSAPASVQAAMTTVAHAEPQLKTLIEKATTEPKLLSALAAMGSAPGVSKAETTINKYAVSICGA
jgi:hypothetical protein